MPDRDIHKSLLKYRRACRNLQVAHEGVINAVLADYNASDKSKSPTRLLAAAMDTPQNRRALCCAQLTTSHLTGRIIPPYGRGFRAIYNELLCGSETL